MSGVKLEYCDGEIYAMAGGTPTRADLTASMIRLLGNALAGRCRVSSSDLKVRVEATDLSTFPDVTVVCGERTVAAIDPHAVTNPTFLVEVTSEEPRLTPHRVAPPPAGHRHRARGPRVDRARVSGRRTEMPSVHLSVDELYDGIELV